MENKPTYKSKRPLGVTILAWFNFLILVMFLALIPLDYLDSGEPELESDIFFEFPEYSIAEEVFWDISSFVFLLLCFFGFLYGKNWSRWLFIIYPLLSLLVVITLHGTYWYMLFDVFLQTIFITILFQKSVGKYFTLNELTDGSKYKFTFQDMLNEFLLIFRKFISIFLFIIAGIPLPFFIIGIIVFFFNPQEFYFSIPLLFIAIGFLALATIAWSTDRWRKVLGIAMVACGSLSLLILAPLIIFQTETFQSFSQQNIEEQTGSVLAFFLVSLPILMQILSGVVLLYRQKKIDRKSNDFAGE
ncbi:MAG: hypothetical protein KAR42_12630 [candidate division Zixibacteria bacterium]|nr:hypothetical protein [candidate division Zixibacteria bacterium]